MSIGPVFGVVAACAAKQARSGGWVAGSGLARRVIQLVSVGIIICSHSRVEPTYGGFNVPGERVAAADREANRDVYDALEDE